MSDAPEIPAFYFMKENATWKFALWKSFELGNLAFSQVQKNSGLEEDEFLIYLLENISRFEVDKKIFEGPID